MLEVKRIRGEDTVFGREYVLAADFDAQAAELVAVREQQAKARRAADRIAQLCTTPHESKERFTRRVQSVIEWERAAQQEQPK